MRRPVITLLLLLAASAGHAGPAQRACLSIDRSPGPRVCACAQAMADQTLSVADQKRAASIMREPDLFTKFQKDKGHRSQAFVERYRLWGERVEEGCGRL